MLISFIQENLTYCSFLCFITVPFILFAFFRKRKLKKTLTKEEYEEEYGTIDFLKLKFSEKILPLTVIILTIVGLLYSPIALFGCGNTQIGNLLEKREYKEQYLIKFRTSKSDDAHILVADIEKTNDYGYVINKVYFSNGGYITFSSMPVTPRKEIEVQADNNEWYYITLTKEKVSD